MATIRLLVADDHEVIRRGVRSLLGTQPGWEVSGEAASGREAVEKAKQLKPDLVVLDITMPELDGLEATRQILEAVPKTKVLILTMHESEQVMSEVLKAGALGYVLKSDAADNLVPAVKALIHGKPFFTSSVSKMMLKGYLKHGTRSLEDGSSEKQLSPRERLIVQLLVEGKKNKEIAAALGISTAFGPPKATGPTSCANWHCVPLLISSAMRSTTR